MSPRRRGQHDPSYKQFFSYPEMVRDLLLGFVPLAWVESLDFATLERVNQTYISDDLRERADDVVWRVRFRDEWLYVYLLLEFQSTVDRFMAVRLLTYVGLLYQDLIKSGQISRRDLLPPVMPIVLYNGERTWRAATALSDLLPDLPPDLQRFQPTLQYLLIDEQRQDPAALAGHRNLVAALIRAEGGEPTAWVEVIANLLTWLDREEQAGLRRAFQEWFLRLLERQGLELEQRESASIRDLTELQGMLNSRVKDWEQRILEQGIGQGIEKGIEKGIAHGEVLVLKRQLIRRFGPLPRAVEERIDRASRVELETWLDRVLEAGSLDEVLG